MVMIKLLFHCYIFFNESWEGNKYLLSEDDGTQFVSKDVFEHGDQLLMVEVLHPVEVVEVQEHHLSGMR